MKRKVSLLNWVFGVFFLIFMFPCLAESEPVGHLAIRVIHPPRPQLPAIAPVGYSDPLISGVWTDMSGRHPMISVDRETGLISIDMFYFNRPKASGRFINDDTIEIKFPDDAVYTAHLDQAKNKISWNNGTVWTRYEFKSETKSETCPSQECQSKSSRDKNRSQLSNLIQNGSFEEPKLLQNNWHVFEEISGWRTVSGTGIEVQRNVAGSAFEGEQLVELDSHNNSAMVQIVPVVPRQNYLLSFAYSPRPGVPDNSNGIRVFVDDKLEKEIAVSGLGLNDTCYKIYEIKWRANANNKVAIRFEAFGTNDTLGGYIDDVSFIRVDGL